MNNSIEQDARAAYEKVSDELNGLGFDGEQDAFCRGYEIGRDVAFADLMNEFVGMDRSSVELERERTQNRELRALLGDVTDAWGAGTFAEAVTRARAALSTQEAPKA